MLLWAHHDLPILARDLEPVRVATGPEDLHRLSPGDALVLGRPGFEVALSRVPRGAVLASWEPAVVARARSLGWVAVQLPGPDPEAIRRAVQSLGTLLPVSRGTVDPVAGELWTASGRMRLPAGEVEALRALIEAAPAPARCPRSVARRLRQRLGAEHVISVRKRGYALRPLSPAPEVSLAVPSRAPAVLGPAVVDLDGQRVLHGDTEARLTAREAHALALLLEVAGVVPRAALAEAFGTATRRALDLAVHRLRAKLGPGVLETVRNQGYRLRRDLAPTSDGRQEPEDVDRIVEAAASSRLVSVTGPCFVGKSHLARLAARRLTARVLDLHGVDPPRAVRLLERRLVPTSLVLVDGLDDAACVAQALHAALARGCRVLLTARAPAGLDDEHEVRVDWTPGADRDADDLARRLEAAPSDLRALSIFSGPFDEHDARLAGAAAPPAALARLGWVEGSGPWRVPEPYLEVLRRGWTALDHHRHERVAAARAAAALDAPAFRLEAVRACFDDLVAAHEASGDPALAVLRAEAEQELRRESGTGWLAASLPRASDPARRAELLFHLAQRDEGGRIELLRRAADLALDERRLELLLELAWYLRAEGRDDESAALLDEVEVALERLPDSACLYARAELQVLRAAASDDDVAQVAGLADLLGRLETARFSGAGPPPGHRRTLATRRTLAACLGATLLKLGRVDEADAAWAAAWAASPDPDGSPSLLVELAAVAARRGRWDEADDLLRRTEEAADAAGMPAYAVLALGRRALFLVRRGEPGLAMPLLARAEGHEGLTADLRGFLDYVHAHRHAALGDPDAVVRHLPGLAARITVPLGEALVAVARAVRAHRRGLDPTGAVRDARALMPALAEGNPGYPEELERLLANAGYTRGTADPPGGLGCS